MFHTSKDLSTAFQDQNKEISKKYDVLNLPYERNHFEEVEVNYHSLRNLKSHT